MNKNYNELLTRLNERVNPEGIKINKSFSDELRRIPQKGVFLYIKRAMQGVEPEYTQRSKEAGRKVRDKLEARLFSVDFEFQGSVMTNTHIKGYSDIDLLTICNNFYTFDRDGINSTLSNMARMIQLNRSQIGRLQRASEGGGYTKGLSDLRGLRIDSEEILQQQYLYVNISKPKSIIVNLTNPKRNVDVVIANWYKNSDYYIENDNKYLGVKIFVKGATEREDKVLKPDFPFLSISRINDRDSDVNGRLKKMIRFLKTIKGDSGESESIELSSFDFNAICYDINTSQYRYQTYIELVLTIYGQLNDLATNPIHRRSLKSVDGHELIFINEDGSENSKKVQSLQRMLEEVRTIIKDIEEESRNLKEAV